MKSFLHVAVIRPDIIKLCALRCHCALVLVATLKIHNSKNIFVSKLAKSHNNVGINANYKINSEVKVPAVKNHRNIRNIFTVKQIL